MAFISYDSYKNRIEKLAKFKNFVEKYKFLIMGVLAVIIAGASALMATKGMITSDMSLSAGSYTYGDPFTPTSASAFLSDIGYEYTVQGKDEWTDEKPVKVGKYSVRAVSNKLIGKGYGTPVNFEILPKKVEFAFGNETTLIYGNKPQKYDIDGLVLSDKIDVNGAAFAYDYHDEADNVSEWTVDVTVAAGSVKIVDKNGNDSSDCYIYETAEKTFALAKRSLPVNLQSSDATYCGAEISYKGELISPNLAEGDSIAFETEITQNGAPAKLLDAGAYGVSIKENSIKITKGGADVTKRYDIGAPQNGKFTVKQRPLTITTADDKKVYDGKALSNEGATSDNLVVGHKLRLDGTVPSITDVDTVLNEQSFIILDASGDPVTANYDCKYKYGYLTVTPRPLTVTTKGGEWEYDGTAHPVTEYNASGLADGQVLVVNSYASESFTDVSHSGKNSVEYRIEWQSGGAVSKNNYDVTASYGDIKITARPLKVTTDGATQPYNGEYLTRGSDDDVHVTYAGEKSGQTGAFIKYGEKLSVVGSLPRIINVGTKENAIDFAVPNNNYYIKDREYGTLQITQAEITVTLDNASCDYGDDLPKPGITLGGSLFGSDKFNPVFKYLKNGATPAAYEAGKTYEISLDTVNSTFTYGNSEPVTTPNYKIINNPTSTLTVGTRAITVYLNDTTVVYGNTINYNVGNEDVDGVVSGQTVQVNASLVEFDKLPDMPDAGTYTGAISCPKTAIKISSGTTDVTSNYDVTVEVSTLTVSQRPITVHANDILGVIYGVKPEYGVAVDNYKSITGDGLANKETLTINNVSYLTVNGIPVDPSDNPDKGTYKIKPSSLTIKKPGGGDSLLNYKITPADDGVLTIVARPITIQSATDIGLIYDGTAQYNTGNKVTSALDILSGHRIEVTKYTTVTDVSEGTVTNELKYAIKDSFSRDVTDNYAINNDFGTLKVNPRPITVELNNYTAVYGESYAYATGAGNYENTPDLVNGEKFEITQVTYEFGTVATPDARDTAYWVKAGAFKVTKSNGALSTGNYQITPVDGSLEITKRHIEVTLKTYSATYGDGYAYTIAADNYAEAKLLDLETGNALVAGETLKITAVTYEFGTEQYPDVKVGGYWVSQAGYEITKAGGADGKGNYTVDFVDGTLNITKRAATVTLNDIASVTYGNSVAYAGGNEASTGILRGHTVTVNATTDDMEFSPAAAYPNAGDYTFACNSTLISISDGSSTPVTGNYDIEVIAGNLEITQRKITVQLNKYSATYGDGYAYEKGAGNYDKTELPDLVGGDTLEITAVSYEFGTDKYPIVGIYTVSQTDYKITKPDGADSKGNYKITWENGELTITKRAIELTSNSVSWDYDGKAHNGLEKGNGYYISDGELPEDADFKIVATALTSVTNYSATTTTYNELSYDITYKGVSVKSNFDINPVNEGILSINQRHIIVYTDSDSWEYDGTAHSNGGYKTYYFKTEVTETTQEDGLCGNDKLTVITDPLPSITDFGTEENVIVFAVPSDNYVIDRVEAGTLEITKRPVKIKTGSATKPYDGSPLTCNEITATYGGNKAGQQSAFVIEGEALQVIGELPSITDAGTTDNTIEFELPSNNYEVIGDPEYGTLTVTQLTITIQLNTYKAIYGEIDGDDGYTYATGEGNYDAELSDALVGDEKLEITKVSYEFGPVQYPDYRATAYWVRQDGYEITKANGDDSYGNYKITWKDGALTVTKRRVIVIIEDTECTYGDVSDEDDLPTPKFTVTGVEDGKDGTINGDRLGIASFNWERKDGKEINSRFDAGEYTVSLGDNYTFTDKDGKFLTVQNYEIADNCEPGTLTIKKRTLDITFNELSREYGSVSGNPDLIWFDEPMDGIELWATLDEIMTVAGGGVAENLGERIFYIVFHSEDEIKNCGDYELSDIEIRLMYSDGERVTVYRSGTVCDTNYDVNIDEENNPFILHVTQKALTVTLGGYNVRYGDEVVITGGETAEGQLEGHTVRVNSDAEFEFTPTDPEGGYAFPDAGTYEFICTKDDITVKDGDGNVVTTNYDITVNAGGLYIYALTLNVKLNPIDEFYGETVKNNGANATGLLDGHDILIDDKVAMKDYQGLNATSYALICSSDAIKVVDGEGKDVTRNYSVIVTGVSGGLRIKPRPVTVTLQDVEGVVYGDDLPVPECVVEGYGIEGGLVGDDKFKLSFAYRMDTADIHYLDVGDYTIVPLKTGSYFTDAEDNRFPFGNYEIIGDMNEVTFKITQRHITIKFTDGLTYEYGDASGHTMLLRTEAGAALPVATDSYIFADLNSLLEIEGEFAYGRELHGLVMVSDEAVKGLKSYELYCDELFLTLTEDGGYEPTPLNGNYLIDINTLTINIVSKKVELDLDHLSFTYGDEEEFRAGYEFTSKVGDLAFDETLTLKTFYAVEDGSPIEKLLDAGDYEISANQSSADFSDENGQDNYEVTFTGTLTVEQREITIELWDIESVTYGEALEYPLGLNKFDRLKGDFAYGQQLKVYVLWKQGGSNWVDTGNKCDNNAGTYKYNISVSVSEVYESDGETKAKFKNYSFICDNKEAIIKPFEVKITPNSDTKVYDGDAYVYDATSYSADKKLPNEERLKISVTYTDKNGNAVDNPTEAGTYYIYFKEIVEVIAGTNADTVVTNYTLATDLPDVEVSPDDVAPGDEISGDVVPTLKISKREITVNTVDLPDVFYGEPVEYKVEIGNHADIGGKGLVAGHHLAITSVAYSDKDGNPIDGVPTAVGTYYIVPISVAIYDDNGESVNVDNYDVGYLPDELGTVKIMPISLHLVTNSHTWVYNGEYRSDTGYTLYLIDDEGNVTDKEFTLPDDQKDLVEVEEGYTQVKNACTDVENVVKYDFSKTNYTVDDDEYENGLLTITPLKITILSNSSNDDEYWIYDGYAKFDDGCEVTSENQLIAWHQIIVSEPATVTFVTEGEVSNTQTYTIIDTTVDEYDADRIVTDNYVIDDTVKGTLKVNPRPIGLKSEGKTFTYKGDEQYWTGYTTLPGEGEYGLVDKHQINVTGSTTIRTVMDGKVDNVLTYEIVDEDGNELTLNYDVQTPEFGKLEVIPVEISIVLTNGLEVTYGDALYPDEFDNYDKANSTPLVKDEKLKVAVTYEDEYGNPVTPKHKGTYTVVLDLAGCNVETDYGVDGFGNYTVKDAEYVRAQITIIPKDVTVSLNGLDDKVYGEAFVGYGEYEGNYAGLSVDKLPYNDTLQISVSYYKGEDKVEVIDGRTPAGDYDVRLSAYIVRDEDGEDITDLNDYNIYAAGIEKLRVTPRPIYVVTESDEKVYSGTALYSPEAEEGYEVKVYYKDDVDGTPDGIVNDDKVEEILALDATSIRSIVNAGDRANDVSYILLTENPVANNYELIVENFVYGTLTVLPKTITISLYEFEKEDEGFYYYGEGEQLIYKQEFGNFDTDEDLVAGEQVQIAISWLYNGSDVTVPQNAGIYNYQIDKANSIVIDAEGNVIEDGIYNYYFIYDLGEVEIKPFEFEFTVLYGEKTYDGTAYAYQTGYGNYVDAESSKLPYKEKIQIFVTYYDEDGEPVDYPTNAGKYVISFDENTAVYVQAGDNPDTVASNYALKGNDNELHISKRAITVKVDDEEFGYWIDEVTPTLTPDNLPDCVTDVTASSYAYKLAESADEWQEGLPSDVGTYWVIITDISLSENGTEVDYSENYEVGYEKGTINIIKLNLYLLTDTDTFDYDGDAHQSLGFTLYRDEDLTQVVNLPQEMLDLVSVDEENAASITNVSESGKQNIVAYVFNTENFNVPDYNYRYGTLTMNKRQITILSNSSNDEDEYWIYDGYAKSDEGCEVTSKLGLVKEHRVVVDLESLTTVTYVTESGVDNTQSYKIYDGEVDVSGNYEITAETGKLKVIPRPITVKLIDLGSNFDYGDTVSYQTGVNNYTLAVGTLADGEALEVAVIFYTEDGDPVDGEPKNAGRYYYVIDKDNSVVTGSAEGVGIGNYAITCDDEIHFKISKLNVTVTLADWDSEEYTGEAFEYSCEYTYEGRFADGEELDLKVKYKAEDGGEISALIDAGTYTVIYDGENSTIGGLAPEVNYEIIILPNGGISFTITPKNITIIMGDESREYDGKVYDYLTEYTDRFVVQAANGENNVPDRIIPAEVIYEDGISKNVGTYKVALAEDGFNVLGGKKSNYKLVKEGSTLKCKVDITHRDISFTVEDWTIERGDDIIDETMPPLSVGGSGFVVGEELEPTFYIVGEGGALTPISEIDKDEISRGTYEVCVKFISDNAEDVLANYDPEAAYVNGTLTVTARQVTVTPTYSGSGFTYNGSPISLEDFGYDDYHTTKPGEQGFIGGNVPASQFLFTDEYGNEFDAPVNAGTYTVTVNFLNVNPDHYLIDNSASIQIKIAPRPVTVTLSGYDKSKLDGYLTYSFSAFPQAETLFTEVSLSNIVPGETSTAKLYYHNKNYYEYEMDEDEKVIYNYAGNYEIRADIVKDGEIDTNYKVDGITKIAFTVEKAPLYVTPIGETNVKYTHEGQTLELTRFKIWEEYGVLYGDDTLSIEGSNVLKTTAEMSVIIRDVTIMQGSLDVTYAYDVHHKYEKDGPISAEEYRATLSFKPIDVQIYQPEPAVKEFLYDKLDHSEELGVNIDGVYVYESSIIHSGYTITINRIIPIRNIGEYDVWVQIIVRDSDGKNITSLYNFVANSESKVVVYANSLDLTVDVSDGDLAAAWEEKGTGILAETETFGDNVYYVLDESCYTLSGLLPDHVCKVLVMEEGEDGLAIKVIVYDEETGAERSTYYELNAGSASLITMSELRRLDTTTTTQADTSATIGGNEQ